MSGVERLVAGSALVLRVPALATESTSLSYQVEVIAGYGYGASDEPLIDIYLLNRQEFD